jgi:hypothetical protein
MPQLRHYADRIGSRLKAAYRPSTTQTQRTAAVAMAVFCLYHDIPFPGVSVFTILAYIEFLFDNGISVPTIKNYVSALKSMFKLHNVSHGPFDSPQVSLALLSLTKNTIPAPINKPILAPHQFCSLVNQTVRFPLHLFYKISFLFGYFALLRISNVAPISKVAFDPLRHLRRGDVWVKNNILYIHLRWTKTLQRHRQVAIIPIYPGQQCALYRPFVNFKSFFL